MSGIVVTDQSQRHQIVLWLQRCGYDQVAVQRLLHERSFSNVVYRIYSSRLEPIEEMKMLFPGIAEHILLRLQRTVVPQSKETLEETTYATCAYDLWGPLTSCNPGGRTNMFMPGMDCCATSSFDDFVAWIEECGEAHSAPVQRKQPAALHSTAEGPLQDTWVGYAMLGQPWSGESLFEAYNEHLMQPAVQLLCTDLDIFMLKSRGRQTSSPHSSGPPERLSRPEALASQSLRNVRPDWCWRTSADSLPVGRALVTIECKTVKTVRIGFRDEVVMRDCSKADHAVLEIVRALNEYGTTSADRQGFEFSTLEQVMTQMVAVGPRWGLIWFGTQLVVVYLAFVTESNELKPRAHCFVMHQHSGSNSADPNVWTFWKVLQKVAELAKRSPSLPDILREENTGDDLVFNIPDCERPPRLKHRKGVGASSHGSSLTPTMFCAEHSAQDGPTMGKAGALDWAAAVPQMQLLRLPLIHQSSHSYVGLAMGPNGSRAAVKARFPDGSGASDTEGAETEVKVLNLLKNHQGNGIPILFAYTYVAVLYIRLPALVLQYVGARNGDDLPMDVWRSEGIKRQVRNLFNLLHEKNMTHGDPALRQLVVADGSSDSEPRLFLVDFERVTFNATHDAIKNEVEAIERMMRRPSDDSEQHQLSPRRDIGTLPL
eukprot:jgi/Ulvmu1/7991/UM004_0226.1